MYTCVPIVVGKSMILCNNHDSWQQRQNMSYRIRRWMHSWCRNDTGLCNYENWERMDYRRKIDCIAIVNQSVENRRNVSRCDTDANSFPANRLFENYLLNFFIAELLENSEWKQSEWSKFDTSHILDTNNAPIDRPTDRPTDQTTERTNEHRFRKLFWEFATEFEGELLSVFREVVELFITQFYRGSFVGKDIPSFSRVCFFLDFNLNLPCRKIFARYY